MGGEVERYCSRRAAENAEVRVGALMKRLILSLFLVVVGMATSTAAEANFAQRAFQPYLDSGELPGVITVFHKDGHEEISCLGFADVAAQRPMSLDDVFQQCSQTKGFCGVTVAQLIEAGKVALDDPVANYLPEFKTLWVETANTNGVRRLEQARQPLTLRHCLTHTGGFSFELANFTAMGGWSHRMPLRSVAATAAATPLLFEPGTGVRYSNVGIDVAAAVVEVVTGQRWEDVVSERILKPLGMNATGFQPTDEQLKTRIEIYRVKKGKKAEHVPFCASMPPPFRGDRVFSSAGAGLWTTARDQLKFYKMLMNLGVGENGVRILKEETVRRLLAVSQRPKSLSKDGYSLGFVAPFADEADGWFGHGGAWASQCLVNGRRKELRMLVVQVVDAYWPRTVCAQAAEAFFRQVEEKASRFPSNDEFARLVTSGGGRGFAEISRSHTEPRSHGVPVRYCDRERIDRFHPLSLRASVSPCETSTEPTTARNASRSGRVPFRDCAKRSNPDGFRVLCGN